MSALLINTTRLVRSLPKCRGFPLRTYVSRKDCAPYEAPKCAKDYLENQPPCPAKMRRIEANQELPKTNSMWENPECCTDPCPDYTARSDELYYKMSDKLNRKYQQTWINCPELQIKPKKICCFEQLEFLPLEKRVHSKKPQTACPQGGAKICMESKDKNCPKFKMAGCQGVRSPPKCKTERLPSDCKKECTPYPSFSECLRNEAEQEQAMECKCLNHPMMCEVWAEMRRRMTFVK